MARDAVIPRHLLTKYMARTGGAQANHTHISTLWTLGIPKMYMGALNYKGKILH